MGFYSGFFKKSSILAENAVNENNENGKFREILCSAKKAEYKLFTRNWPITGNALDN